MRRLKVRRNIKKSKVVLLIIALVFFFTTLIFKSYTHKASEKIISVAQIKLNEFMEGFLSKNIGYKILNDDVLEDILVINKNENGEILYVDYNLDKAYFALDIVTKELNELITELENGNFTSNKNVINGPNGMVIKMPLMIFSDNAFLASLGPSIYVPVNFVGAILTNIKSKITDYGLNNALVELYVTIKLNSNLITPVSTQDKTIEYDVLVASSVINGRVPEVYGGFISSQSSALSIPID